jgi:hypothetical protein
VVDGQRVDPRLELALALADDELILGHRHSEWTGWAPYIEEDLAFSSIAQDEMAHARVLYRLARDAGLTERDEDDLALALLLPDSQRLLDGVDVEGVQRSFDRPVEPLRLWVEPLRSRGVGDLLDADRDLHGVDSNHRFTSSNRHEVCELTFRIVC